MRASDQRDHPRAPAWLRVPVAALAVTAAVVFGWLVQQRLAWFQHATRVDGTVVERVSRTEAGQGPRSTRNTTRLEVVTEVPDPAVPGGRTRFTTLAPLYYPFADVGDRVPVFSPAGGGNRFVLAHPANLALPLLIALAPLGFLLPIADVLFRRTPLKRHWRAAVAVALVLPVVIGQLRAL